MLRVIQAGNTLPISYPLDPTSTFQSGQFGQLKLIGQDVVLGLSDGTAPIGIIDDNRTTAFTSPVKDEVIIIESPGVIQDAYGNFLSEFDVNKDVRNPHIVPSSFISDYEDIVLNARNGMVTLPAGSVLNWYSNNDGAPDSVKILVSYVYRITDIPGDDTTIGSNRITIWFQRGIFETDQFDTTQQYPLNTTLFVNTEGLLTSRQPTEEHPGIAICLGPPNATTNTMTFMFL